MSNRKKGHTDQRHSFKLSSGCLFCKLDNFFLLDLASLKTFLVCRILWGCERQIFLPKSESMKVSKGANIRNRYNQVPHLTKDTNGKVTNSQLDTTTKSQAVSPFPAGDHKAHINRHVQRHSKHKTEKT